MRNLKSSYVGVVGLLLLCLILTLAPACGVQVGASDRLNRSMYKFTLSLAHRLL